MDYKKIFILGLGFFGVMIVWTLYNAFTPVILSGFITSNVLIGLIMTFDNILAVTVQPVVGALSDRTKTSIGRRKPYLIIGAPFAAIFFCLIPVSRSFWLLIMVIVLMNFFMAIFRSPVIALMPDITPSVFRSRANGIINFMGGLGAVLALLAGGILFDIDRRLPFYIVAGLLFVAVLIVVISIKEPGSVESANGDTFTRKIVSVSFVAILAGLLMYFLINRSGLFDLILPGIGQYRTQVELLLSLLLYGLIIFVYIIRSIDRNSIFIFLAVFFWFFGYNGIETFFTLYGTRTLGVTAGEASMILGVFSLSFIIFAIPSGFLASRIGRKRMIIIGLVSLTVLLSLTGFIDSVMLLIPVMFIGGAAWSAININAYPMICDLTTDRLLGTYTGLYYFFSMLAQTMSPPLIGAVVDYSGTYRVIFYIAPVCFLLAIFAICRTKGGEVKQAATDDIMENL